MYRKSKKYYTKSTQRYFIPSSTVSLICFIFFPPNSSFHTCVSHIPILLTCFACTTLVICWTTASSACWLTCYSTRLMVLPQLPACNLFPGLFSLHLWHSCPWIFTCRSSSFSLLMFLPTLSFLHLPRNLILHPCQFVKFFPSSFSSYFASSYYFCLCRCSPWLWGCACPPVYPSA